MENVMTVVESGCPSWPTSSPADPVSRTNPIDCLTPQAPDELYLALRTGPHFDLHQYCDFLEEDDVDDVEGSAKILQLSKTIRTMLESGTARERITTARDVVRAGDRTGLAYVVLAREGAKDKDEAEELYLRSVSLLKQEADGLYDDELGPYYLDPDAYCLIAGEAARFIWQRGRRQEALDLLRASEEFSHCEEWPLILAASYLIQESMDIKAVALLDFNASTRAEWYFTKALLLFRVAGDSPAANAALKYGYLTSKAYRGKLLLTEQQIAEETADERSAAFMLEAEEAWRSTEGAIHWLFKWPQRAHQLYPAGGDPKRENRWQENIDLAESFARKERPKEFRKFLKMALREAEWLGRDSAYYNQTLKLYVSCLGFFGSIDEIHELLESQLKAITQLFKDCPAKLAHLINDVAELYDDIETYQKSAELYPLAVDMFKTCIASKDPCVDLSDLARAMDMWAVCMGKQGCWGRALELSKEAIALAEQFLGKYHVDLSSSLRFLIECLTRTGEVSEAKAVLTRLVGLRGEEAEADQNDDDDYCKPLQLGE